MKIISKKVHNYGSKLRRPGAAYDATKEHARFLVANGFATYAPDPPAPVVTAPIEQKYKTREVKAETDKDSRAEDGEKFKRQYNRRDLKAEE